MECENCDGTHNGEYGSGRFCLSSCARSYSTKEKREKINKKVSEKMLGIPLSKNHPNYKKGKFIFTNEQRIKGAKNGGISRAIKNKIERDLLYNTSWEKFIQKYSKSTRHIKEYIIKERGRMCEVCKLVDWQDKNIVIEIHHIDGNKHNNKKENLRLLCPNCHSQTDSWKGKNKKD